MRYNERVKNLDLGWHREVAVAPDVGKLGKSAQPASPVNVDLLLQAGLGVDNAPQVLEGVHQPHMATVDGSLSRQLRGTPAH